MDPCAQNFLHRQILALVLLSSAKDGVKTVIMRMAQN